MKYLRLFENFKDIESLCGQYGIQNYSINDEGTVDVYSDVLLIHRDLDKLPIKFGKVSGNFSCRDNKLTSLEGSPKMVIGFNCRSNKLTSLEGSPKEVGGDFRCSSNKLTSLEGCPSKVDGNFESSFNQLTSLDGCPEEVFGNFDFSYNYLSSLEGCPEEIFGNFNFSYNELSVIYYLPVWIDGNIYLESNKIRDIKVEDKNYIFSGKCYLRGNPINDLFQYWEGNLKDFIRELEFEDFIRDDGKSLDITRFEYALNGKEYDKESIKRNYKLIYRE